MGKENDSIATNSTAAADITKTWDFVPFGISWVFIGFVLLLLASFPASEKFAAMFAYLILVSAVLIEGPNAVKNLQAGSPFGGQAVQSGSITTNVGTIPLGR
jgi:hypothetical protein